MDFWLGCALKDVCFKAWAQLKQLQGLENILLLPHGYHMSVVPAQQGDEGVLLEVYKLYDVLGRCLTDLAFDMHRSSLRADGWRAVPLRWVLQHALQAANLLAHLHHDGLTHGDMSPNNILVDNRHEEEEEDDASSSGGDNDSDDEDVAEEQEEDDDDDMTDDRFVLIDATDPGSGQPEDVATLASTILYVLSWVKIDVATMHSTSLPVGVAESLQMSEPVLRLLTNHGSGAVAARCAHVLRQQPSWPFVHDLLKLLARCTCEQPERRIAAPRVWEGVKNLLNKMRTHKQQSHATTVYLWDPLFSCNVLAPPAPQFGQPWLTPLLSPVSSTEPTSCSGKHASDATATCSMLQSPSSAGSSPARSSSSNRSSPGSEASDSSISTYASSNDADNSARALAFPDDDDDNTAAVCGGQAEGSGPNVMCAPSSSSCSSSGISNGGGSSCTCAHSISVCSTFDPIMVQSAWQQWQAVIYTLRYRSQQQQYLCTCAWQYSAAHYAAMHPSWWSGQQ